MNTYTVSDILHYCNISVDKCSPIAKHPISCYDLTFVLKGSMMYIADNEKYVLCENDAILLPPGTVRQRFEGTRRVQYVSFNFKIFSDCELALPRFMKNAVDQDIRTLMGVFSQKHLSTRYNSRERLCNLLNYILYELLNTVELKSNDPQVIKIERFIDDNIFGRITLDMIAQHVHLSKEYVAYLFKKHMGITVIDYVNEKKMILAKNMIQTGEMSLKDVAENLGYENYGYFSRLFKKHFNTSPISFKKNSEQRTVI